MVKKASLAETSVHQSGTRLRNALPTIAAFFSIYVVWGSTFLAIRIAVLEMPPFLVAAIRFSTAGFLLFAWMRIAGTASPTRLEWKNGAILGAIMFLGPYGALFWAEQRVESGLSAVILATVPLWVFALEIVVFRTRRLRARVAVGLAAGLTGVTALMLADGGLGGGIDELGALVLIGAAFLWALGTILARNLALPSSKPMSAAIQMFSGGLFLFVISASAGEFGRSRLFEPPLRAWGAIAYLVLFGSLISFTAYVWLLGRHSPSAVATYAYINPIVAVLLGWWLAGERLGAGRIAAATIIVAAVVLVMAPERSSVRPK